MGKSIVALMLVGTLLMIGSLVYVYTHREDLKTSVLGEMTTEFQARQDQLLASMPPDLAINPSEPWNFSFVGDELHIAAPSLIQKTGAAPSTEQFEAARTQLTASIHGWLTKKPGDDKRFPVRIRFKNEP
ncbi:MAG: hypothetical protein KF681_11625 [Bdellovibrionaceae bacterium]|nr:hypothetical protein [Pseudobdellovibrionaceae bacterium]